MAVTWTVTNLVKDVGARRYHSGTATATPTSTYSSGGDNITAAQLGLGRIDEFRVTGTPQNATPLQFQARAVVAAGGATVAIRLFGTNAAPGAAVADPQVTAATNVDNYVFTFESAGV